MLTDALSADVAATASIANICTPEMMPTTHESPYETYASTLGHGFKDTVAQREATWADSGDSTVQACFTTSCKSVSLL